MPDVIEAPYRPAMLGENRYQKVDGAGGAVGLGPSCLAGDVIGDYRCAGATPSGQRFAFLDRAHHSMVKTTTFSSVPLPSIWLGIGQRFRLECVAIRLGNVPRPVS